MNRTRMEEALADRSGSGVDTTAAHSTLFFPVMERQTLKNRFLSVWSLAQQQSTSGKPRYEGRGHGSVAEPFLACTGS